MVMIFCIVATLIIFVLSHWADMGNKVDTQGLKVFLTLVGIFGVICCVLLGKGYPWLFSGL